MQSKDGARTSELAGADDNRTAAEERIRPMVQHLGTHAIFLLDPAGIVATWNAGAQRIKGYTAKEIIGQHFSRLSTPEDAASGKPERALRTAVESGFFEDEGWRLRKDGSRFWATVTITPTYDDASKLSGFLKVTREISARKPQTNALADSVDRLKFALQLSHTGTWEVEPATNRVKRNAEHDRIFGYESPRAEWTYQDFLGHVLPEDRAEVDGIIQEALRAHQEWQFECRIRRADGVVRWISSACGYRREVEGQGPLLAGILQDITERRAAEEARIETEQRLLFALEHSRIGSWVRDLSDGTESRTPMLARIFGYESLPSDWNFGRFLQLVLPEDRPYVERTVRDAVAANGELTLECRIRRMDGEVRWIWTRGATFFDGNGKPLREAGIVQDITEQKRASEALQERERLLSIVTGTARVGLVVVGAGYRYLFANEAYADIFGLGTHEIVGKRVPDVLAAGWSQIQPKLDRALGGERVSYELTLPAAVGTQERRHYSAVYEPRLGNDGERSVVVVVVDITARKRTEEALRASEERLRLMIEAVNDHAIFMLDPSGHILTWNGGAERISGYAAEEIVGQHCSRLYTTEEVDSGLPQQILEQAAVEGRVGIDGWKVRKDGSRFWANGTLAALYDESRRVKGFASITRDLTAKRHNDELLRSVLDNTLDAIIGVDARGRISLINEAGESIFGRPASEVVGQDINVLLPGLHLDGRDDHIAPSADLASARAGDPDHEVRGLRKDGSNFPIELSVTEFRLDNETNYVAIVRDITDRQKLEDQLRHSQKMDAIGQLAGGVAHDFNNLLTVISGSSSLLLTSMPANDLNRKYIKAISHAGERAAGLTRQLLFFSRRDLVETQVLDVNAVIRDAETMLRRLIGEDIVMTSVLDPRVGKVKADPGLIGQVLMNLAVNARDAMPQGGSLTIETSNVELGDAFLHTHADVRPGRYVLLALTDTGTGMPPEIKARIFEPFYTTKGVGKGTGLGLSVVHGIVKQSHGHIDVYSEVGIGTTFKLYFPVVNEEAAGALDTRESLAVARGNETILLVEDEDSVRDIALLALEANGYRVLTAESGPQALHVASQHGPDIDMLVTDVVMPGMSGRKLAEELRPQFPRMKVLYVSGYTDDAVIRHGILQADVAFLQKPYTPTDLVRKLRQVLDGLSMPG